MLIELLKIAIDSDKMLKNNLTEHFYWVRLIRFQSEDLFLCLLPLFYLSISCSHMLCAARLWIKNSKCENQNVRPARRGGFFYRKIFEKMTALWVQQSKKGRQNDE